MNWEQPKVYAVKHRDERVRAESRSGGVFTAVSDLVLENGGIVYGCAMDEEQNAVHIRAVNAEARDRMRGSKYVQSRMGDTFRQAKADLDEGRKVLFSGTSCQIAGLRGFLRHEYENLLCVDIVCHGVPSPLVWKKYLAWQNRKHRAVATKIDFRNKKDYGWSDHVERLTINGKNVDSRVYTAIFYSHCAFRPSCYVCPFKHTMHPADITIGDFWGIDKAVHGFNDNKGVSLVLINNEKGEQVFEAVKQQLHWQLARLEDSMQPALVRPYAEPAERKAFWNDVKQNDFEFVARKYGNYSPLHAIKWKLGAIRRKLQAKVRERDDGE